MHVVVYPCGCAVPIQGCQLHSHLMIMMCPCDHSFRGSRSLTVDAATGRENGEVVTVEAATAHLTATSSVSADGCM
jgi:hypothetical protein